MKTKQSNGEMVVNSDGGVGVLGTYGDITKAAVEVGKWHRVVMAVKCASGGGNKGELRTWVDTVPAAVVSSENICTMFALRLKPALTPLSPTGTKRGYLHRRAVRDRLRVALPVLLH